MSTPGGTASSPKSFVVILTILNYDLQVIGRDTILDLRTELETATNPDIASDPHDSNHLISV